MKILQCIAALGITILGTAISLPAAFPPVLNEHLKPMEWMLGHWEAKPVVDKGDVTTWKLEVKPDLGGTVVSLRCNVMDKENRELWSGYNLYYWQPVSKSIGEARFVSPGGHGTGILIKQTEKQWIWQGYGYDVDANFGSGLTEAVIVDDQTFTANFRYTLTAGEVQPDFMLTFKRIEPTSSAAEVTGVTQEIIKLEEQANETVVKRDIDAFGRLLADDYIQTFSDGSTFTKNEAIASLKSGDEVYTSIVLDQPKGNRSQPTYN